MLSKNEIKKEIDTLEKKLKEYQTVLTAVSFKPIIVKTKYAKFQISEYWNNVPSRDDAVKHLDTLNEEYYQGHNDWRIPSLGELFLLLEAKFYICAEEYRHTYEFYTAKKDVSFCPNGKTGYAANCNTAYYSKNMRVIFIRNAD